MSCTNVSRTLVLSLSLGAAFLSGCAPKRPPYPETQKRPVTDEYHGIRVVDDYRWLEQDSAEVRAWVASQNEFTRSVLDKIPYRSAIAEHLRHLYGDRSVSYTVGSEHGKLFVLKNQPPREQPFLVTMQSADDPASEKVVLDPNTLDSTGTTAIDFYVPSLNGRLVAVSLSKGGSEDGSVSVFETATGRRLADVVPRVNYPTASGSLAWNAAGTGFYYTRYPQGTERPPEDMNFYQQVYFHRLGTPSAGDTYVIGREFPRIAEIQLASSRDGRYLLASVANGDGGEFAHYLMGPGGTWKQITAFNDQVKLCVFGRDENLYLLSTNGAPRGKVLTVPLRAPDLSAAKTLIPEGAPVIDYLLPTLSRVYLLDIIGGPSQVRVFDLQGNMHGTLPTGPVASVSAIIPIENDQILYGTETYLEDFAYFRYEPATNSAARTHLANTSSVSYSDCEILRENALSKDGTLIPINILRRKGTPMDGSAPLILYGYGGYAITEAPKFSVRQRIWLDQGGVYVWANLRGGGEFGEQWHNAGKLTKKQNVFDDFIACAQYLIEKKYTSPERLAIEGGSNGGLLMGAVLTQRPDLFRAVVSYFGVHDMLRVELFPNGAFNVTEYGTVKDPDQFKALYAYSPYHHVQDGVHYPAVLMVTGDNDGRVNPSNSRKMIARLQAASASPYPIMLRTSSSSGHGIGSSLDEAVQEQTDVMAFLMDQLKVPHTLPQGPAQ